MKKTQLLLLLMLPLSGFSQLKINEIMTNNVSAVMDDKCNYSMWLELYNTSADTGYNQYIYYLTDDLTRLTKWRPSSKIIPANGFSVLWFERDDISGHASFKLSPEGGKIYLVNSSLQVVDSVVYPRQYRNVSYGRKIDGTGDWGFFEQYTSGTSNNGKPALTSICPDPVFELQAGFYASSQYLYFSATAANDTIYYTTDCSEPTRKSTRYINGSGVFIYKNTAVRARVFSAGKMPGNIVTRSYFINQRDFKLPVVSIVTAQPNLTDNTIGIYVAGTNGITGNGSDTPVNWNQDWDRPANFELIDTTNTTRLNQELDISVCGAWSRLNPQKSLKISPKKKFGNNKLNYDIFAASKPGRKYKDIQLRNSGNDFYYTMMRDAFMESLIAKRLDLEYLAYEPAVCFMNGAYYGIQNLRETSGADLIYSAYGYDDDEIYVLDQSNMAGNDTTYTPLTNYLTKNDISQSGAYANVGTMMDIDNFANYMISEIYYGNNDWPHNNIKIWKKKTNGRWRWILFDTDFGYNLYNETLYSVNSLLYVLGEKTDEVPPAWSTLIFRKLIQNESFKNKFIDRFCIHLSSSFETSRVNHIMDSIAAKISTEISFHKTRWTSYRDFNSDIVNMKTFSANRPAYMLSFISNRLAGSAEVRTASISSTAPGTTYTFNNEPIIDQQINLKYFLNRSMSVSANTPAGYTFDHWEFSKSSQSTAIPYGAQWKYYDGSSIPASDWTSMSYVDAAWKTGTAPLGYGGRGEVTTISYGTNASLKYITAYFRKTVSVENVDEKDSFSITTYVDDGAVVYVNGAEVGRCNMPSGAVNFNTLSFTYNNGVYATFQIPKSVMKEGNNVIAVEVHQSGATSSDLVFDALFTFKGKTSTENITTPVYNRILDSDINLKAVFNKIQLDPTDTTSIVINEIVAGNTKYMDENGKFSDYIELYNKADKAVNIAGWFLTDTPSNRKLAEIPSSDATKTTIPPKGRIVCWADGSPSAGILHVGFKLSKDGETVILSRINKSNVLVKVDSVAYPAIDDDVSYSRIPDGADNWVIKDPTCNMNNEGGTDVKEVAAESGVYPTIVKSGFEVMNNGGNDVVVTDITGRVVMQLKCNSDNQYVSATSLQQGIYLVSTRSGSYKIIITGK